MIMKSQLEKKLTYRALGFLEKNSQLLEAVLENPSPELQEKFKMKNACVMLSGELNKRFEDTIGLLNMTKREFLEAAIIDALDKADAVMAECGVDEYFEELAEHQAKQDEAA